MAKLTLNDLTSGYSAPTVVNSNNSLVEAAIENTLSRDGTGPNSMGADLDMGLNRILNLGAPVHQTDAVRVVDIENGTVTVSPTVTWADITVVPTVLSTFGALVDPNADRLVFWDDSASATVFLTLGTGLSITGTTINSTVSSVAYADVTGKPAYITSLGLLADPNADRIIFWDDSAGNLTHLTVGTGLNITTTSLTLSHLGIQNLVDPNVDRILFWDDSAGFVTYLAAGNGLSITGTSISASVLGIEALVDPNADRIFFWDDSAGTSAFLTAGTGLTITGTTLTTDGATATVTFANVTAQPIYISSIAALTDPNADRILFWDDSAGGVANLTVATGNLAITGTTIDFATVTGSFTGTLTGVSSGGTGTVKYSKNGNVVTLQIPTGMVGTANANTHTMTGAPAAIFPATAQTVITINENNTVELFSRTIVETTGVLTLHNGLTGATFTGTGTEGILNQTFTYHLS